MAPLGLQASVPTPEPANPAAFGAPEAIPKRLRRLKAFLSSGKAGRSL